MNETGVLSLVVLMVEDKCLRLRSVPGQGSALRFTLLEANAADVFAEMPVA